VVLWNRTRATADAAAERIGGGATAATSIPGAVATAGVVITSLADDAAVRAVYTGDGGLGSAVDHDAVVLEMSTIAPTTVREVAPAIEARGADVVDAPVSGSVAFAEAGELTIMAGGRADAIDRARPVLETLSKRIFHLGPLGAGATMKLAVNSLLHGLNVALSEALVLVEAAGVDRADAYDVFVAGAVGAPFVAYKRAAYLDPDATPVAFSLDLVGKDLDLILELAREVGAPMAQASTNRELVDDAVRAGLADRDLSAVAVFLRQLRAEPAG
jgi:3-hydroxyisobutyrate dehydrogenase/2-hydroxy-3-oxopropionate reductase